MRVAGYLPIAEHGVIGNLHTVALVGTDGTIGWCCWPRFDSPSVFASMLDAEQGGFWRIEPTQECHSIKQLYFPDTNVLITRFLTPDGVGEVQDFMPIHRDADARRHLVRRVMVVRGEMEFRMECQPRLNYGRSSHVTEAGERGAIFRSSELTLVIESSKPLTQHGDGVVTEFHLKAGRSASFSMADSNDDHVCRGVREADAVPAVPAHRALLAGMAAQVAVPRTVAGDGQSLGTDVEAPDLPAHRRDRGRTHHQPARADRRRPKLGLPVHLDPRCSLLGVRPVAAGLHRRGGRLHGLVDCALPRVRADRLRTAADHVRHRRPPPAARRDARSFRGLPAVVAGADRKRRGHPAAARHLWRAGRLAVPLQQVRRADLVRFLG